jgi:hypothetical protein
MSPYHLWVGCWGLPWTETNKNELVFNKETGADRFVWNLPVLQTVPAMSYCSVLSIYNIVNYKITEDPYGVSPVPASSPLDLVVSTTPYSIEFVFPILYKVAYYTFDIQYIVTGT